MGTTVHFDSYRTIDEMMKYCDENNCRINKVHILGQDGILHDTSDLTDYYAVYAYDYQYVGYVDWNQFKEYHDVAIYVGMSKDVVENIISDLRGMQKGNFNAVSVYEMEEYFNSLDRAFQFIECGKRLGLLESCGEGFYAF